MYSIDTGKFITPTIEEAQLPTTAEELYRLLDSGKLPRKSIGAIVRNRYKQTAQELDQRLVLAKTHDEIQKITGLIGAFNYIRGMPVFKKDDTIDREVAPKMMVSPSASVQLLDLAKVRKEDNVLELFSGAGYLTFFLSLTQAQIVDSVDLYTPDLYKLDKTFDNAYQWIYGDLPEKLKPQITKPNFIKGDATNLPDSSIHYDKVFLSPPYGRESRRVIDISEETAYELWQKSLNSVSNSTKPPFTTYSVIPSEWAQVAHDQNGGDIQELRETRMMSLSIYTMKN